MKVRHYILATAGHVDHGKSALVRQLTGTDPDRLPEEKQRGITIDLGFAQLDLDDPSQEVRYSLGIVDVPGHEDFVKNMVAGVGSVDLALLVVAADDGWMPQTEEHLQILTYLGVSHAVVALSKADLARDRLGRLAEAVRARLQPSSFAHAPLVPVSATTGEGIAELREALLKSTQELPEPPDLGKPRLAVDRVFSLAGKGTILTGTLSGGCLARGETVQVQPGGFTARIRALQRHHEEVTSSGPGTRTALNLVDVAVGRRGEDAVDRSIRRGDTVVRPGLGRASSFVDVWIERSRRLAGVESPARRPLKNGMRLEFHHGSGHQLARLRLLHRRLLEAGEGGLAQLRLARPAYVMGGDRFILRDAGERWTLAGGRVLEPVSSRSRLLDSAHLDLLRTRAASPEEARTWVLTEVERDRAVPREGLLAQTGFGEEELQEAIDQLCAAGELEPAQDWLVRGPWWRGLVRDASEQVEEAHRRHPERAGLELNELRRSLQGLLPAEALFSILTEALARSGFVQEGPRVRRASHQPTLPPHLHATGEKLRAALLVKPFEPPSKKDLLKLPGGPEALRFFIQTGEAVDLGGDTVLAAGPLARATRLICRHLEQEGAATASELRRLLRTNRRVIIPLLEHLDRERVTVRQEDRRVLGPASRHG